MEKFFKNVEIAFRKSLIRILAALVRSPRPLPEGMDFTACKFLFVRQDRIGDVLISTPLFALLKKHYPNSIIHVLLSTNNHFALANEPLVTKRWIYEKNVFGALKVLTGVRREHYDFVIDLMDNPSATSTVLCLFSNSRWSVGLDKDNSYAYDIVVPLLSRRDTHIVDRIAQLLVPFRIDPAKEDLYIRYFASETSRRFAESVFEDFGIARKRTIGINISAGDTVRFWGEENFRNLISLLQRDCAEFMILVLFKPAHRQHADNITKGLSNVFLSPVTESFDEFAALIEKLTLLITPDTSAVHLASAFRIPAVVMYVQSNKELRIWDPYRSPSRVLVADVDDLRVISTESVFKAAMELLPACGKGRINNSATVQ